MKKIIDGMARAMYVCWWADREEERGRSHGGEELTEVAPATNRHAKDRAWLLCGMFEQLNGLSIMSLFVRAMIADGILPSWEYTDDQFREAYERYSGEFGHYLAMRATGTGCAWEDDHAKFEIEYPNYEYYA